MEIYCSYYETVFRNESTGFTIFKVKLKEFIPEFDNIFVSCKGYLSYSMMCLPLKLVGTKIKSKYGDEFEITEIIPYVRTNDEAIEFLSSNCFKGISEKMAKKIVDKIGHDLFVFADDLDAYSKLVAIEGIGPARAKLIVTTLKQATHQKELLDYITQYGGNFITSERLLIKYGAEALASLKRIPYKAGIECGLSFLACDMIAKDNGFTANAQERISAIVSYIIKKDYDSGNVYTTLERVIKNANHISAKKSAFIGEKVSDFQVICACDTNPNATIDFAADDVHCYYKDAYSNEVKIAKNIRRLQKCSLKQKIDVTKLLKTCERELKISYSEKQKECFKFLASTGVKVITGGPGTGKSTIINGLTYAYHSLYPDNQIVMMAPTGRAAQRIKEITGREAGTIHRMLGLSPFADNSIQADYLADYPADLIIVDESSMIDNELMAVLVESLKNNSTLILVGDIDQLPSIGAGAVLRDIITAGIESVKLDVNYRQKGKSTIIDNAQEINKGFAELKQDDSFIVKVCESADEIREEAEKIFNTLYDKTNPYSVQILSPQFKGAAGIRILNNNIQKNVCKGRTVIAHTYSNFKLGDKVMATANNYTNGYFNGDIGIITETGDVTFTVMFSDGSKQIPRESIEDFQLAYACSIHKSQGSEYDNIIICLPYEAISMINKNLLYTAVTRAKKRVYIITQNYCIKIAVGKTATDKRVSGLANKIKKHVTGGTI